MSEPKFKTTDWQNCYNLGWGDLLIPEAYSHPAKMSRALVFKIITHALERGWINPGETVVDCFGGVGTTALPCLMNGISYVGVELEEKFVLLGRKNIELWENKFSNMPKWGGTARLLQGDSRRLSEVVSAAGLVVGSPPYADSINAGKGGIDWGKAGRSDRLRTAAFGIQGANEREENYGSTPGQLGSMRPGSAFAVICSPPFAGNTGGRGEASRNGIDAALFDRHSGGMKKGTGNNPANLDHLPQGNIAAVIGSPPFAGSVGSDDPAKRGGILVSDPKRANDTNLTGSYGATAGQLAGMVVGSPPFEDNIASAKRVGNAVNYTGHKLQDYGSTPGQLGTDSGPTFWTAAAEIVAQCAMILPPGAVSYWVVKDYVKGGQIIPFSDQWRQLCEVSGFETVEIVRAWLVKKNGAQAGLNGEMVSKDVERKSFFRRLAEKKGSPRIDWETVLIMRRL